MALSWGAASLGSGASSSMRTSSRFGNCVGPFARGDVLVRRIVAEGSAGASRDDTVDVSAASGSSGSGGGKVTEPRTTQQPEEPSGWGARWRAASKFCPESAAALSMGGAAGMGILAGAQQLHRAYLDSKIVRSSEQRKKRMETTLVSELFLQEEIQKSATSSSIKGYLSDRINKVAGRLDEVAGRLDEVAGRLDEVAGKIDNVMIGGAICVTVLLWAIQRNKKP